MGVLIGAVHWWEESQLRVLVLTSLLIQFFLFSFPILRRLAIPGWFRFIMWLAYHAGDAVAIYALATLFNRHKADEGDGSVGSGSSSNTLLEVVWAPVLLIHLGGNDGVTAYNIEDNELWSRHLLTAVSQVTVAIYVFCRSWPPAGGDKKLLQAAILMFVIGVGKCFFKAWAFKKASIYSRVSSRISSRFSSVPVFIDVKKYYKLEGYVKDAREIVVGQQRKDPGEPVFRSKIRERIERQEARNNNKPTREALFEARREVFKLFVDLPSSYPHRISILHTFWGLREDTAYDFVRGGLASMFLILYTKLNTSPPDEGWNKSAVVDLIIRSCILLSRVYLPWAPIALFHHSNREAYNAIDVKVTYALLCCTAALEGESLLREYVWTFSTIFKQTKSTALLISRATSISEEVWPETVAQYSLAGYFVRNKKHNIKMRIVSLLQCKDFLDQHWCMEPCFSSARITHLVLRYLEDGWKDKIQDTATYLTFNNHSSQWVLNMNRPLPFDECVLLWHLATDFCFFSTSFPDHRCPTIVECRQMSNYMVYLLFVNPEMLPGCRQNLFKTAYDELKGILKDWEGNPVCWSRCMPCRQIKEEEIVMRRLIEVMQKKPEKRASQEESSNEVIVAETIITVTQEESERPSQEGSSTEGFNRDEKFIDKAWDLAQMLLKKDEGKMWKEIRDAWVQMLCFSASRCRGYLHAKALGQGGEFLSYVWLLLFHMGMETFSDRLQRELLPSSQAGNFHSGTTPPPTSEDSTTGADDPSASTVSRVTRAAACTTAFSEIREVGIGVAGDPHHAG